MRQLGLAFAALILATVGSVLSAANVVPSSKATRNLSTIDANALKPNECASLNLTAVVTSGTGTSAAELVVGTNGADTLSAGDGGDCVVAGDGNDSIDGGAGTDVCLGGNGTDTYVNCETLNDPDGSSCSAPGMQTVLANADTWLSEKKPNDKNPTDSLLDVWADPGSNRRRALVNFPLPSIPAGCTVTAATLRMYAASSETGQTLQAFQAASAWTESQATWNNQPATTGAAASAASGPGWVPWDVLSQVQAMYADANYGFLIMDPGTSGRAEQRFNSRESTNDPELVITFS